MILLFPSTTTYWLDLSLNLIFIGLGGSGGGGEFLVDIVMMEKIQ